MKREELMTAAQKAILENAHNPAAPAAVCSSCCFWHWLSSLSDASTDLLICAVAVPYPSDLELKRVNGIVAKAFHNCPYFERDEKNLRAKTVYWLNLAAKHRHRGEHYQELCDYLMAADYLFQLKEKIELRKLFKKHPDLKRSLREEILKFCDRP